MTGQEMEQLYNNLAAGVNAEALKQTNAIGAAAAAKGPSLGAMNTGGNGIGSYNYNRLVAPTVNQMKDQLVMVGKQYAFKQGVNDAMKAAQEQYSAAAKSYQSRQAERARQAALAAARQNSGGGTTGGGSGSVDTGVDIQKKSNAGLVDSGYQKGVDATTGLANGLTSGSVSIDNNNQSISSGVSYNYGTPQNILNGSITFGGQ